jgi:threonine/homoserine efflux transporter RhtA
MTYKPVRGYIEIFLYCSITAMSALMIHETNQVADPTVTALYTFLICGLFFNVINYKKFVQTYQVAIQDKKNLFLVNITTAASWLVLFWAFKFLDATLCLTLVVGVSPISSYLFSLKQTRQWNMAEFLVALIVAALVFAIVVTHQHVFYAKKINVLGVVLALIAGVFNNLYIQFSRRFNVNAGLAPVQILSVRFYLLIILSVCLSCVDFNVAKFTHGIVFYKMPLLAIFSTILPLYLSQNSIQHLGAAKVSYLMPMIPVVAYILSLCLGEPFRINLFLLILSLSVAIPILAKIRS